MLIVRMCVPDMRKRTALLLFLTTAALQANTLPFVLDRIQIESDGVSSPEWVKKKLGLKKGMEISMLELEKALNNLKSAGRYSSLNYQLIPGVRGRKILNLNLTVNPGYRPEPGEFVTIDRIIVNGNWKTHRKVILRELLFDEGQRVDTETIEESIQRVLNRNLFFEIDWGLYDEDDDTVIEIRIREKWTFLPIVFFEGDSLSGRMNTMFGALDSNFLGQGSFLMTNVLGTFVKDEPPRFNFNVIYIHRLMGKIPLRLGIIAGTHNELSYITHRGVRTDAFHRSGASIDTKLTYEWDNKLEASLLLKYHHDVFSRDEIDSLGFNGYQMTENHPGFGMEVTLDRINSKDQHRQGYKGTASLTMWTPFQDQIYWEFLTQAQYHQVFAKDWLTLSARIKLEYSSSIYPMYQIDQKYYLRGGDSHEYFSPLVFGVNLEFGIVPIRQKWMFLEVAAFCDVSWHGSFTESFHAMPQLRVGPGLRISFPPVGSKLTILLDMPFNEHGIPGFYFSMIRFF